MPQRQPKIKKTIKDTTKHKNTRHSLAWFQKRYGKTIYRDPIKKQDGTKCCDMCESGKVEISEKDFEIDHARYLYDCQQEYGIFYRDNK